VRINGGPCAHPQPLWSATAIGYALPRCGTLIWSTAMMDVIMLAIGLVFFALSIGYVYACDRL
jgi:hypothetical protein